MVNLDEPEKVLGLTQTEEGLDFVCSLFFVNAQSTEQVELVLFLLLLARSLGFAACF